MKMGIELGAKLKEYLKEWVKMEGPF